MSIVALVAAMMETRKKDSPFGNLLFPGNPFSSLSCDKEVKKPKDNNGVNQRESMSQDQPLEKSKTDTPSDIKPESPASNRPEKEINALRAETRQKQNEPVVDERFLTAVVEKIKVELPTLIERLKHTPSQAIVSETYDAVYRSQLAAAQAFLNENRSADLSRVKCLLHKLLPRDYFEYIEQLKEHQDPQTIINIMGGQNIVAPNAQSAKQSFSSENSPKKGS